MIPPLDPAGLLLAVLSAAFFVGAIVYVIRSKGADRLEIPLTSFLSGEGKLLDHELFAHAIVEPQFSPGGLLISVGLHLVLLMGTPFLSFLFPSSLDFEWRKYDVRMVEFSIPEPLLYSGPERSAEKKAGKRAAVRRTLARQPARIQPASQPPATAAAGARPAAPPRPVSVARSRPTLQLPSSPQSRSRSVIIQPDAPQITISVPVNLLPTAFIWAQQPAPIEPTRIVGNTPRVNLPTFSLPRAEPKVQRPNRELAIADLQIAPSPVVSERPPLLPVTPANVSPVRIAAPPIEAPGQLPATAIPGPNPTNLIALMENPAPPAPSYTVQAGNRLAEPQPENSPEATATPGATGTAAQPASTPSAAPPPRPAPSAASSTQGAGTGPFPSGAGQAPGPPTPQATPSAAAAPSGPPAAPPQPAQPAPPASGRGSQADLVAAASSNAAAGAVSTPGAGTGAAVTGATGASRPPGAPAYPSGNLGVIIVQQAGEDTGLEGSEVLSGHPVYTVYFDVPGSPRRWILEYCVPGSDGKTFTQPSEGVIHILPKRTVQPPYPMDRIPLNMRGYEGQTRRLVIFATVNERGETGNVRLIRGTGQDIDETAVTTLRRWTFRPAMRGETPVAIEALFGIPLQ